MYWDSAEPTWFDTCHAYLMVTLHTYDLTGSAITPQELIALFASSALFALRGSLNDKHQNKVH
jgi:hypothetical protein